MGYTHYWRIDKNKTITAELQEKYNLAMRQCSKIAKHYNKEIKAIHPKHCNRLSGYTVHVPIGKYLGLDINGTQELGHEQFYFPAEVSQLESFNFCKTANKPYDDVVTACLITLNYYLKDLIDVSSDGWRTDWNIGLELATKVLKIKGLAIPKNIETKELRVVV